MTDYIHLEVSDSRESCLGCPHYMDQASNFQPFCSAFPTCSWESRDKIGVPCDACLAARDLDFAAIREAVEADPPDPVDPPAAVAWDEAAEKWQRGASMHQDLAAMMSKHGVTLDATRAYAHAAIWEAEAATCRARAAEARGRG